MAATLPKIEVTDSQEQDVRSQGNPSDNNAVDLPQDVRPQGQSQTEGVNPGGGLSHSVCFLFHHPDAYHALCDPIANDGRNEFDPSRGRSDVLPKPQT